MKHSAPRLFGTDGIRGLANSGPLQIDQVQKLGLATAQWLSRRLGRQPRFGLGRDTRMSSPALAAALTAGLSAGGAEVWDFGVTSTPAVSRLLRAFALDGGSVISASHNPAEDNGIKYFNAAGGKFPDADERALEAWLHHSAVTAGLTGTALGQVRPCAEAGAQRYCRDITALFRKAGLSGLRVVADLAHGANGQTAPAVFSALGIQAVCLANQPDGLNINAGCGSLHPGQVSRKVRRLGAQAGLAFDGDGDRVMLVDEKGRVVNGDRMLSLLAGHYARRGRLTNRVVVATVMSNLGLEMYLKAGRIRLRRATVGDRFVAQAMTASGSVLGGEQSGHILLPRKTPTGDGLLTALEVLSVMQAEGKPLSELAWDWEDYPQILVNVSVSRRPDLAGLAKVQAAYILAQRDLREQGRVNLRYSGTELVARVMVEARTPGQAEGWAQRIADAVEASIGNGQGRKVTWLTSA